MMDGQILYGGDLNDQFYFWKSFYAENIRQGIIPFWNPYSFSGTPFLAHPSIAAFYPFNIIFFIFPLNIAFSVYLFIHVALAGIFMYWLCVKTLASRPGLEHGDKIAAIASAVIFSLSGLMGARIYSGHIDIISTLIWIPAVFWSVTSALESRKKKDIFRAILFLTLQILAGYQAVVLFTLELIFMYQIVLAIFDHKDILHKFIKFISIIIISFGISAIQLLPTIEFVRNSIRGAGLPYDMLTWGSYTKDLFFTFIQPFRYGNPFPENYTYNGPGPNFFEISYFVGVIPIILFFAFIIYQIISYCSRLKAESFSLRSENISFIGLSVVALFFSLAAMGNNFPLHKLLYQTVPFYRLFRFPSQHLIVVVFIISLIAGLSMARVKNRLFRLVILLLITAELLSYDKKFIRLSKIPTATFDHKLTSLLSDDKELARILPDYSVVSRVRKAWDFESSMYYKIQSTSGYNPILLNDYYHFIDLLNKNYASSITQYNVEIPPPDPASKEIDFLNIKYVLMDKNFDLIKDKSLGKYTLKFEGNTYRLYENKDYLPRFFTNCPVRDKKDVEVVDYQINYIKLKTSSTCDGNLSSSEVYYPGWKARIDGKETQIFKSNTAFRSIFLPKDIHTVEFYYQATIYYIGGLISLFSIIITIIWLKRSPKTESNF